MKYTNWLVAILIGFMFGVASCDDGGSESADATSDSDAGTDQPIPPVIDRITLTENPANALSAFVAFETDVETTASVEVERVSTGSTFTVGPTATAATDHEIGVIGLYAEEDYTFTIIVESDSAGSASSEPQDYTTSPLPSGFPPIQVLTSEPDQMAPGYTVVGVNRWNPGLDQNWGMLVMLDSAGEVVWYYYTGFPTLELQYLSNGEILYTFGLHGAASVDLMGNSHSFWFASALGMESMHHEISPIEDGNYVVLSTELREISGYPDGEGGTEAYYVVGDVIYEMTEDGTILKEWTLFDYFDPLEIPDGFHDPFYDMIYAGGDVNSTKDWTHANAVLIDPTDDNYLISVRNYDRIIKLDRSTDEILWEFGEGMDFTMDGGGEFQFHQHSPVLQDNGNLLIYDNGNNRSSYGPDDPQYTRVVEYELDTSDPEDLRARQVWEFRGEEPWYAQYLGDVKRLSNDNVLITNGGILADPTASESQPGAERWGTIFEVTYQTPAEVVFEVEIRDLSDNPTGYSLYRAERILSLYP